MEAFVEERLAICRACPIVKNDKDFGLICDSRKYISPDGTQGSIFKKDGWRRGCGCILTQKSRNKSSKCIVGKW